MERGTSASLRWKILRKALLEKSVPRSSSPRQDGAMLSPYHSPSVAFFLALWDADVRDLEPAVVVLVILARLIIFFRLSLCRWTVRCSL